MTSKLIIVIVMLSLCLCYPIDDTVASELKEPPADSSQAPLLTQSYYHLYGAEPGEFNISEAYPWFDNLFNLYVTDHVAQWDSTTIAEFILMVMDSDSTNSDDVFPVVWNYFCYKDSDPSYAGIEITIRSQYFTDINIRLYDINDIECPGPFECSGWSWYSRGTNYITLCTNNIGIEYLAKATFAHELQHLCFEANGPPAGYNSINETLSMAAMHLLKSYELFDNEYDLSYDASIYRGEQCDPDVKYYIEEIWIGYLLDVLCNAPSDITDDLVYNWLRFQDEDTGEITMNSLAEILTTTDYSWLGGTVSFPVKWTFLK